MRKPLRLLPVILFAGALILTVKVGGLWSDLSVSAGAASSAETPPSPASEAADSTALAEEAADLATLAAVEPDDKAAVEPEDSAPVTTASAAIAAPQPDPVAVDRGEETVAAAPQTSPRSEPVAVPDPFDLTDEEIEVLQSLAKRREQLDAQERALQQREALLAAAEQRMDQKLAELKTLQETITGLMKQHDAQAQAQINSLVKIYENMKPKDAARIFEQLEMDVLLDVVAGMKETKVAAVLAEVNPIRAKDITLELSERRNLPLPE